MSPLCSKFLLLLRKWQIIKYRVISRTFCYKNNESNHISFIVKLIVLMAKMNWIVQKSNVLQIILVVRIKIAYQGLGFVTVIMIVVTIVTKWKIVTQEFVWLTSFDVLLENVFLFIGNVSSVYFNRGYYSKLE